MGTRLGLRKQGYLLAALVALLPTIGLPPDANADMLTIDDIIVQHFEDGNPVNTSVLSGTAEASFSGNTLTIILTNTSSESTGFNGATNLLTGIAFNLPSGVSIESGSVSMAGSNAINFIAPLDGDISGEWGFDNHPIKGPFVNPDLTSASVNTSVATMESSTTSSFGASLFSPDNTLDGPEMGLLSGNVCPLPESCSTAGGLGAVQDSIIITLNLSGSIPSNLVALIEAGDVVLSFGSPDAAVPEPATLLLLGTGLLGLGFLGRKRLLSGTEN